jgi:hypothetical protein
VRGADLAESGAFNGPEIGETLRRLEAEWIQGGFTASREDLLAHAAALSRKSPKRDR